MNNVLLKLKLKFNGRLLTLAQRITYNPYQPLPCPSIILVNIWLGPWPFWMSAFLRTCSYNSNINWLIYCNSYPPKQAPSNVKFKLCTEDDLSRLASTKLGYECSIDAVHAYKLCDYRPAYGHIFEDDLKEFDFWGHCDLDVIWGNIRTFLTPEVLYSSDIVSSRTRRLSGHFTIYRNIPQINTLYKLIPSFADLLSAKDQSMFIDEELFSNVIDQFTSFKWYPLIAKLFRPNLYLAWQYWLRWYSKHKGTVAYSFTMPCDLRVLGLLGIRLSVCWNRDLATTGDMQRSMAADKSFSYNEGRTFGSEGNELMYIHFHILKRYKTFKAYFANNEVPARFTVNHRGFYSDTPLQ